MEQHGIPRQNENESKRDDTENQNNRRTQLMTQQQNRMTHIMNQMNDEPSDNTQIPNTLQLENIGDNVTNTSNQVASEESKQDIIETEISMSNIDEKDRNQIQSELADFRQDWLIPIRDNEAREEIQAEQQAIMADLQAMSEQNDENTNINANASTLNVNSKGNGESIDDTTFINGILGENAGSDERATLNEEETAFLDENDTDSEVEDSDIDIEAQNRTNSSKTQDNQPQNGNTETGNVPQTAVPNAQDTVQSEQDQDVQMHNTKSNDSDAGAGLQHTDINIDMIRKYIHFIDDSKNDPSTDVASDKAKKKHLGFNWYKLNPPKVSNFSEFTDIDAITRILDYIIQNTWSDVNSALTVFMFIRSLVYRRSTQVNNLLDVPTIEKLLYFAFGWSHTHEYVMKWELWPLFSADDNLKDKLNIDDIEELLNAETTVFRETIDTLIGEIAKFWEKIYLDTYNLPHLAHASVTESHKVNLMTIASYFDDLQWKLLRCEREMVKLYGKRKKLDANGAPNESSDEDTDNDDDAKQEDLNQEDLTPPNAKQPRNRYDQNANKSKKSNMGGSKTSTNGGAATQNSNLGNENNNNNAFSQQQQPSTARAHNAQATQNQNIGPNANNFGPKGATTPKTHASNNDANNNATGQTIPPWVNNLGTTMNQLATVFKDYVDNGKNNNNNEKKEDKDDDLTQFQKLQLKEISKYAHKAHYEIKWVLDFSPNHSRYYEYRKRWDLWQFKNRAIADKLTEVEKVNLMTKMFGEKLKSLYTTNVRLQVNTELRLLFWLGKVLKKEFDHKYYYDQLPNITIDYNTPLDQWVKNFEIKLQPWRHSQKYALETHKQICTKTEYELWQLCYNTLRKSWQDQVKAYNTRKYRDTGVELGCTLSNLDMALKDIHKESNINQGFKMTNNNNSSNKRNDNIWKDDNATKLGTRADTGKQQVNAMQIAQKRFDRLSKDSRQHKLHEAFGNSINAIGFSDKNQYLKLSTITNQQFNNNRKPDMKRLRAAFERAPEELKNRIRSMSDSDIERKYRRFGALCRICKLLDHVKRWCALLRFIKPNLVWRWNNEARDRQRRLSSMKNRLSNNNQSTNRPSWPRNDKLGSNRGYDKTQPQSSKYQSRKDKYRGGKGKGGKGTGKGNPGKGKPWKGRGGRGKDQNQINTMQNDKKGNKTKKDSSGKKKGDKSKSGKNKGGKNKGNKKNNNSDNGNANSEQERQNEIDLIRRESRARRDYNSNSENYE